jgi:N utilization substance protein A
LAGDELIEILAKEDMAGVLNEEQANDLIMLARAHWFAEEDAAAEAATSDETNEAADKPAEDGDA